MNKYVHAQGWGLKAADFHNSFGDSLIACLTQSKKKPIILPDGSLNISLRKSIGITRSAYVVRFLTKEDALAYIDKYPELQGHELKPFLGRVDRVLKLVDKDLKAYITVEPDTEYPPVSIKDIVNLDSKGNVIDSSYTVESSNAFLKEIYKKQFKRTDGSVDLNFENDLKPYLDENNLDYSNCDIAFRWWSLKGHNNNNKISITLRDIIIDWVPAFGSTLADEDDYEAESNIISKIIKKAKEIMPSWSFSLYFSDYTNSFELYLSTEDENIENKLIDCIDITPILQLPTKDQAKACNDEITKTLINNILIPEWDKIKSILDYTDVVMDDKLGSVYFEDLNNKTLTSTQIENFIEDLYDLRKESIAAEGEYGLGNLIFKEFRNLGYLDNLKDLRKELKGKELSLESLSKDNKPERSELKDLMHEMYGVNFKSSLRMSWDEFKKEYLDNLPKEYVVIKPELGVIDIYRRVRAGNRMRRGLKHILQFVKNFNVMYFNDDQEIETLRDEETIYLETFNAGKSKRIADYRKLAHITESEIITEDSIDEHALSQTCIINNNYPKDLLRSELLG